MLLPPHNVCPNSDAAEQSIRRMEQPVRSPHPLIARTLRAPTLVTRAVSKTSGTPLIAVVLPTVLSVVIFVALVFFVRHIRARRNFYALAERNSKFTSVVRVRREPGQTTRRESAWQLLPEVERRIGLERDTSESENEDSVEMGYVGMSRAQGATSPETGVVQWGEYSWEGSLGRSKDSLEAAAPMPASDLIRLDSDSSLSPSTGQVLVSRRPRIAESLLSNSPPYSPPSLPDEYSMAHLSRSKEFTPVVSRTVSPTQDPQRPRPIDIPGRSLTPCDIKSVASSKLDVSQRVEEDPFTFPSSLHFPPLDSTEDLQNPFSTPPPSRHARVSSPSSPTSLKSHEELDDLTAENSQPDLLCMFKLPSSENVEPAGLSSTSSSMIQQLALSSFLESQSTFQELDLELFRDPAIGARPMQLALPLPPVPASAYAQDITSPGSESISRSSSGSGRVSGHKSSTSGVDLGADHVDLSPFTALRDAVVPIPLMDPALVDVEFCVDASKDGIRLTEIMEREEEEEELELRCSPLGEPVKLSSAHSASVDVFSASEHDGDRTLVDDGLLGNGEDCALHDAEPISLMQVGDNERVVINVERDVEHTLPDQESNLATVEPPDAGGNIEITIVGATPAVHLTQLTDNPWSFFEPAGQDSLEKTTDLVQSVVSSNQPTDSVTQSSPLLHPLDANSSSIEDVPLLINVLTESVPSSPHAPSHHIPDLLSELKCLEDAFRDAPSLYMPPASALASAPEPHSDGDPFPDPPLPATVVTPVMTPSSVATSLDDVDLKDSPEGLALSLPLTPPPTPPPAEPQDSLNPPSSKFTGKKGTSSPSSPHKLLRMRTLPAPKSATTTTISPAARRNPIRSMTLQLVLPPPELRVEAPAPVDLALALQLDPVWMVQLLMTMVGWMAILVSQRQSLAAASATTTMNVPDEDKKKTVTTT